MRRGRYFLYCSLYDQGLNTMAKKRHKKQKKRSDDRILLDIKLIILLGVAVLLMLSVLGLCGFIGDKIRFVCFGLFGTAAYAFPPLLFFTYIFYLANRKKPLGIRKLVGLIGLFVFACAFLEMLMVGYQEDGNVLASFTGSGEDHLGGGLVGGALVKLIGMGLGSFGCYLVIVTALVIFAILFTQRPLVTALRKGSQEAVERIRRNRRTVSGIRREEAVRGKDGAEAVRGGDEPEIVRGKNGAEAARGREEARGTRGKKESEAGRKKETTKTAEHRIGEDGFLFTAQGETGNAFAAGARSSGEQDAQMRYEQKETPFMEDAGAVPEPDIQEPAAEMPKKRTSAGRPAADEKLNAAVVSAIDANRSNNAAGKGAPAYQLPPLSLLRRGTSSSARDQETHIRQTAYRLQQTLHNFGVEATVVNATCGPTVTRYELQPEQGVKVSRIVSLADDIKLNLAAEDIRIEAPIPGKAAVGIEVPNKTNNTVMLRDMLETREFRESASKLTFAVGKDLAGRQVIADIAKLPHLLIAGATGSGKSVCINTLIMSVLYKASPDEVKMLMIDPKVVELTCYNGIPHLLIPVVTDIKKAAGALQWAVNEMTKRYNAFAEYGVRDIESYNAKAKRLAAEAKEGEEAPEPFPQILVIVDELADLMMQSPKEVEDSITRLSQLARAAGIRLVIATQRPSVNVITGLIKANIPSRIALAVTSGIDSRVILDMNGAEKLLGKGDMLFSQPSYPRPVRVQGGYVSDEEIQKTVDYIIAHHRGESGYDENVGSQIDEASNNEAAGTSAPAEERDEYFAAAGKFIIEKDKASIGMLQRVYKIGFNRAARIMDQLCEAGLVGPEEGTKPRKILMTAEQFRAYLEENR